MEDSLKETPQGCLESSEELSITSATECVNPSLEVERNGICHNITESTAIDSSRSLECLENIKIVNAFSEDKEDAYHEQFIAAIREHSNNLEEQKACGNSSCNLFLCNLFYVA
jgi:hypothetical protein